MAYIPASEPSFLRDLPTCPQYHPPEQWQQHCQQMRQSQQLRLDLDPDYDEHADPSSSNGPGPSSGANVHQPNVHQPQQHSHPAAQQHSGASATLTQPEGFMPYVLGSRDRLVEVGIDPNGSAEQIRDHVVAMDALFDQLVLPDLPPDQQLHHLHGVQLSQPAQHHPVSQALKVFAWDPVSNTTMEAARAAFSHRGWGDYTEVAEEALVQLNLLDRGAVSREQVAKQLKSLVASERRRKGLRRGRSTSQRSVASSSQAPSTSAAIRSGHAASAAPAAEVAMEAGLVRAATLAQKQHLATQQLLQGNNAPTAAQRVLLQAKPNYQAF